MEHLPEAWTADLPPGERREQVEHLLRNAAAGGVQGAETPEEVALAIAVQGYRSEAARLCQAKKSLQAARDALAAGHQSALASQQDAAMDGFATEVRDAVRDYAAECNIQSTQRLGFERLIQYTHRGWVDEVAARCPALRKLVQLLERAVGGSNNKATTGGRAHASHAPTLNTLAEAGSTIQKSSQRMGAVASSLAAIIRGANSKWLWPFGVCVQFVMQPLTNSTLALNMISHLELGAPNQTYVYNKSADFVKNMKATNSPKLPTDRDILIQFDNFQQSVWFTTILIRIIYTSGTCAVLFKHLLIIPL